MRDMPPPALGASPRDDRPQARGLLALIGPRAPAGVYDDPGFVDPGFDEGSPVLVGTFDAPPGFTDDGFDEVTAAPATGVPSLEADLIAMLRADPGIAALMAEVRAGGWQQPAPRGGGSIDISLNAADEKVRSPYIVVSGTHTITRSIGSVKYADTATFTLACYASTGDMAEELGDAVEQAIYTTGDDLHVSRRSSRVDFETLLDVCELTADGLFDPETGPHVWRDQEWPHYVSQAAAQLQAMLSANVSAPVVLNAADEKTIAPYAVMSATHGPQHTIGGEATADLVTFSIACWGETADEAERLADEVEVALYTTPQVRMVSRSTALDQETGDDVAVITAECWLDENEPVGGSSGGAPGAYDDPGYVDAAYDEGTSAAAGAFDDAGYSDPGFDDSGTAGGTTTHSPSTAVEEMIALLKASPELQALDVIILNAADEKSVAPYVVVTATIDRDHTLDGNVAADHVNFTLACWAQEADDAEAIADAIEQVFATDADDIDVLDRQGGFDQATTMDVAVLTADRWV